MSSCLSAQSLASLSSSWDATVSSLYCTPSNRRVKAPLQTLWRVERQMPNQSGFEPLHPACLVLAVAVVGVTANVFRVHVQVRMERNSADVALQRRSPSKSPRPRFLFHSAFEYPSTCRRTCAGTKRSDGRSQTVEASDLSTPQDKASTAVCRHPSSPKQSRLLHPQERVASDNATRSWSLSYEATPIKP